MSAVIGDGLFVMFMSWMVDMLFKVLNVFIQFLMLLEIPSICNLFKFTAFWNMLTLS
jgi:hypothetical protein